MKSIIGSIALCMLLCWQQPLAAQPIQTIDSLAAVLEKHPDADSIRQQALQDLGSVYQDVDNKRSAQYYLQAAELAQQLGLALPEWRAWYNLGYSHFSSGNYKDAIEYYLKAIRVAEKEKYKSRLANSYMSLGNVFMEMGDFKKAKSYHDQSAAVYIRNNDTLGLASYYNEIGLGFSRTKKLDSAAIYFNKGLVLARKINDGLMQADLLSNLGLNYKKQQRYPEALALLKEAWWLGPQHYNTPDYKAALLNNLGAGYMVNRMYDSAKAAYFASIAYSKESGSKASEMENYRNLGELFSMMNQPDSQLAYIQQYYALKDSLLSADVKTAITQKEADYRLDKKQAEIDAAKRNRNWLLALVALSLLAGAAVYVAWRQTNRSNKQLLELNERISAQKNQLEKLNGLKDRLMSIISHDLRNPLATIQTFFDMSTSGDLSEAQLKPLQQHTSNVVQNTSHMLDNLLLWANLQVRQEQPVLKPVTINQLPAEVAAQVQPQADKKDIRIDVHVPVETVTIMAQEEMLRIVLRNLLTNAVKFSRPQSTIQLSLKEEHGSAVLSVKDNGVGMTPDQLTALIQQTNSASTTGTGNEKGTGLGVFLVHELLKTMQGKLEIESAQDEGSVFSVRIPLLQTDVA